MNKVVYVLLGLSLVANGYFLLNNESEKENVVVKEVTKQKAEIKQEVEEQIIKQEAVEENEDLKQEQLYLDKIAELESEIALLKQQQADSSSKSTGAITFKTSKEMDKELVEKLRLDMNQPKEDFDKESVDPAWAFRRQDEVYDLFANSDITNQLNLKDVTCKTTVCKVTLETFDDKQSSRMMAMMDASQLFDSSDLLKNLSNQATFDEETNEIFMYLYQEDEESD
ncbi:hypothetical protein CW740_02495 [Kangiella profundi]|uniref:Uncharacterized protein n=1 Tax=Kangiella profundi TaxID=1561924 RepID=A0A2K9ACQ3_9GAMM|nr:hypothetical protein [Kangiella profundi]AUD78166.1 hypothetical protein CW740_02495 [Kangiella profundi]GGF05653.1 hypothetical protein GCM10011356_19040 [Kangiella profundi]